MRRWPASGDWFVGGDGTAACVCGPWVVAAVVGRPRIDYGFDDGDRAGRAHGRWCVAGDAAAALAIAVGAVCLVGLAGSARFLANLLSHPILTGYMAGIAVLMIISQLDNFTGIPIPPGDTFTEIGYLLRHLDQVHLLTFGLAVLVLALADRAPVDPAAPGPLVVVVGSTVVVALFDLQSAGVAVVGEISCGLPRPSLPDFGAVDLALVGAALGITVVGYTDNVLTARAFAIRAEDRIDPQQEFWRSARPIFPRVYCRASR